MTIDVQENNAVRLIDFGNSSCLKLNAKTFLPERKMKCRQTRDYGSIRCLKGNAPGRIDDL